MCCLLLDGKPVFKIEMNQVTTSSYNPIILTLPLNQSSKAVSARPTITQSGQCFKNGFRLHAIHTYTERWHGCAEYLIFNTFCCLP